MFLRKNEKMKNRPNRKGYRAAINSYHHEIKNKKSYKQRNEATSGWIRPLKNNFFLTFIYFLSVLTITTILY